MFKACPLLTTAEEDMSSSEDGEHQFSTMKILERRLGLEVWSDTDSEEQFSPANGPSEASDADAWYLSADAEPGVDSGEAHDALLRSVLGRVPSRARHVRERLDAPPEHPEQPSLGWSGSHEQPQVRLTDFLGALSPRDVHHEELKRHIERLSQARPDQRLRPPPHRLAAAAAQQKAAYQARKKELEGWRPVVQHLESKQHLSFPLKDASELGEASFGEAVNDLQQLDRAMRQTPRAGLETTVRDILVAQEALDENQMLQAESRALQHLTRSEIERRKRELARNRTLLFYQEQRAKLLKRITSRRTRRLRKHRRERVRELRIRDLQAIAGAGSKAPGQRPAAATNNDEVAAARSELEALQREQERQRALERATQRHRRKSHWVRHQLQRGFEKLDTATRDAIREQDRAADLALRRPAALLSTGSSEERMEDAGGSLPPSSPQHAPSDLETENVAARSSAAGSGQGATKSALSGLAGLAFMKRAAEQVLHDVPNKRDCQAENWVHARRRYGVRVADSATDTSVTDASESSEDEDDSLDNIRNRLSDDEDANDRAACGARCSHGERKIPETRHTGTSGAAGPIGDDSIPLRPTDATFQKFEAALGDETELAASKRFETASAPNRETTPNDETPVTESASEQPVETCDGVPAHALPAAPSASRKRHRAEETAEFSALGDGTCSARHLESVASVGRNGPTGDTSGAEAHKSPTPDPYRNPWLQQSASAGHPGDPLCKSSNAGFETHATDAVALERLRAPSPAPNGDALTYVSTPGAADASCVSAARASTPRTRVSASNASVSSDAPSEAAQHKCATVAATASAGSALKDQPAGHRHDNEASDEQARWVQVAFGDAGAATAEDEAEFARQKAAQLEAELDELADTSAIPTVLPGWGFWSGAGLESAYERRLKERREQAAARVRAMAQARRRDRQLGHVILSERRLARAADMLQVRRVPSGFQGAAHFEAVTVGGTPLGPEWVTVRTHEQLVRPAVQSRRGVPIAPLLRKHLVP